MLFVWCYFPTSSQFQRFKNDCITGLGFWLIRHSKGAIIVEGILAFQGKKRAANNFQRECAFPGRLTSVPGKRCFVNAVGNGVRVNVARVETGVETDDGWKIWIRMVARYSACSLSSTLDKSRFQTFSDAVIQLLFAYSGQKNQIKCCLSMARYSSISS